MAIGRRPNELKMNVSHDAVTIEEPKGMESLDIFAILRDLTRGQKDSYGKVCH